MKDFFLKLSLKFQRFMVGRYGMDSLYKALLIFYLITIFINLIISRYSRVVYYCTSCIAFLIIIFAFYRVFSKNIEKRRMENNRWCKITYKWKRFFDFQKEKYNCRKTHIFRKCPSCRSKLRLPKKKGKHTVVCPHCGTSFKVKVR